MANELGDGLGSGYPTTIDTDNTKEVNIGNPGATKTNANIINDLASAIVNIETTLGTSPAGSKTDVKTFLQVEHTTSGAHDETVIMTISGAQTVTGQKTFNADINMGTGYKVDGYDLNTEILQFSGNQVVNDMKTFEDLKIKMGNGTTTVRSVGLYLSDHGHIISSDNSNETTLYDFTLPANSMQEGNILEVSFFAEGSFIGSAPGGIIVFYLNNSRIHTGLSNPSDPTVWNSYIVVSGTKQVCFTKVKEKYFVDPFGKFTLSRVELAEDMTIDQQFKITRSGTLGGTATIRFIEAKIWI